jgi:hypothetical protein
MSKISSYIYFMLIIVYITEFYYGNDDYYVYN